MTNIAAPSPIVFMDLPLVTDDGKELDKQVTLSGKVPDGYKIISDRATFTWVDGAGEATTTNAVVSQSEDTVSCRVSLHNPQLVKVTVGATVVLGLSSMF